MAAEERVCGVHFLCTGNSARSLLDESLLDESLLDHVGEGRFKAYSASPLFVRVPVQSLDRPSLSQRMSEISRL